jgi:hypothetical protein
MVALTKLSPIDYLVIGHITRDLTPTGPRLGGTAAYSALTALAAGLRVGIITSWDEALPLGLLSKATFINQPVNQSTTFENVYAPSGRIQTIHHVAEKLTSAMIPEQWQSTPIVHLGPIANEVPPDLGGNFSNALIGVTPQGWLRSWDKTGRVQRSNWHSAPEVLSKATVTIISSEDVDNDENQIADWVSQSNMFVVTDGNLGARVYWHADVRRFSAPRVDEVNATGAGDIFATAFFIQLHKTRDPWAAARFANQVASHSVTRSGLDSVPTPKEIKSATIEVF